MIVYLQAHWCGSGADIEESAIDGTGVGFTYINTHHHKISSYECLPAGPPGGSGAVIEESAIEGTGGGWPDRSAESKKGRTRMKDW